LQVTISFNKDKRQVTILMAGDASGRLLDPQLIYTGKTNRCHPKIDPPSGWSITHTRNHWSDENTREKVIQELGLPLEQRGLYLLDVWKRHLQAPNKS